MVCRVQRKYSVPQNRFTWIMSFYSKADQHTMQPKQTTAGLAIYCSRTKNQFANKPRGLRPIQDNGRDCLKKTQFRGVGPFCPLSPLSKTNASKVNFAKRPHIHFNVSFHADSNGGLGFFPGALVCWQINFVY